MELTKEERQKLEQAKERFHLQELSKDQAEFSIRRKLSDDAWQAYTKSERRKKRKTIPFTRLGTYVRNLK